MADPRAQKSQQTFASWVNQRAPPYNQYLRQVQTANTNVQNYQISVYGPQYRTIDQQRDKIEFRAGNEFNLEPGFVVYGSLFLLLLADRQPDTICQYTHKLTPFRSAHGKSKNRLMASSTDHNTLFKEASKSLAMPVSIVHRLARLATTGLSRTSMAATGVSLVTR